MIIEYVLYFNFYLYFYVLLTCMNLWVWGINYLF